jgi:ribonuclease-3 family protein
LGDAVHTLFVRQSVLYSRSCTANQYNRYCSKFCSAVWQAQVLDKILPTLTEQEKDIVRRARNVKTAHTAKNATIEQYKKATGLEALIGFLHVSQNQERLQQILQQTLGE